MKTVGRTNLTIESECTKDCCPVYRGHLWIGYIRHYNGSWQFECFRVPCDSTELRFIADKLDEFNKSAVT